MAAVVAPVAEAPSSTRSGCQTASMILIRHPLGLVTPYCNISLAIKYSEVNPESITHAECGADDWTYLENKPITSSLEQFPELGLGALLRVEQR